MSVKESTLSEITTKQHATFPTSRLRRLRASVSLRDLVRENSVSLNDLVFPLFIKEGQNINNPIASMPGHCQLSLDQLDAEIEALTQLKISAVMLFGIPGSKDELGSDSLNQNGIIQKAIRKIKQLAPHILVMTDVCFCEYTDHGHCGVVTKTADNFFDVDNDQTVKLLAKQAVSHAKAGADVLAPSGMMDGGVHAIRSALDQAGFQHVAILSHTAKYASSLYGPFRDAAEGAPQFGDRRTYQMDPANGDRAIREAQLDVLEGADILMVKPAMAYLDVIYRIKQHNPGMPIAAYQVSGEFAMIKAAAQNGWLDETRAMQESLLSIKRAGADIIVSYFTKDFARLV